MDLSSDLEVMEDLPVNVTVMEDLPVGIIGNILSRVEAARDLVVASKVCRKWQQAWRNHLHTLAFNSNDWSGYDKLTISELEVIMTRTIVQTKALQCLSIIFKGDVQFSKVAVSTWLICTRKSLRQLHYNVATQDLNILEVCRRRRLELLDLAVNTIASFDPRYQKFPCLRSLSLTRVKISALDLSCWLSTCPKVEVLNLVDVDFGTDNPQMSMEVTSNSLKDIHVETCELKKFTFKGNSLEKLHLIDCNISTFELENAEDIEIVDVRNFTTSRFYFYDMIAKLSKARRMSLRRVMFEDDNTEIVKGKNDSACFPQLTHLSLTYELGQALQDGLLGHSQLENVVEVELRWRSIRDVKSNLVENLLKRCPNLRKLVIAGALSRVETPEQYGIFTEFTNSIIRLMRKEYTHIHIQFLYV